MMSHAPLSVIQQKREFCGADAKLGSAKLMVTVRRVCLDAENAL